MTIPKVSGKLDRYEIQKARKYLALYGPGPKLTIAINSLCDQRQLDDEARVYLHRMVENTAIWPEWFTKQKGKTQ